MQKPREGRRQRFITLSCKDARIQPAVAPSPSAARSSEKQQGRGVLLAFIVRPFARAASHADAELVPTSNSSSLRDGTDTRSRPGRDPTAMPIQGQCYQRAAHSSHSPAARCSRRVRCEDRVSIQVINVFYDTGAGRFAPLPCLAAPLGPQTDATTLRTSTAGNMRAATWIE